MRAAATSRSPTRSSARGRSTSSPCLGSSRTSSSAGRIPSFAPRSRISRRSARLIRFDKRGTGMSDRVGGAPTLETRMDDVRAVMDAVGSQRAALYGGSEGAADERSLRRDLSGADRRARSAQRLPAHDVGARLPVGTDRGASTSATSSEPYSLFGPREQALEPVRGLSSPTRRGRTVRSTTSAGARARAHRGTRADEQGDRRPRRAAGDPRSDVGATSDRGHGRPAGGGPLHGSAHPRRPRRRASRRSISRPDAPVSTSIAEVEQLPHRGLVVRRLGGAEPDRVLATVLFTDIVGSSRTGGRAWRPRAGGSCSSATTTRRRQLVRVSAAARWTPRATASSRPSTGRRARSVRLRDRRGLSARSTSRCGPDCTRASASSSTAKWPASPSTPAPVSPRRPAGRGARLHDGQGSRRRLRPHLPGPRHPSTEGRPRGLATLCGRGPA